MDIDKLKKHIADQNNPGLKREFQELLGALERANELNDHSEKLLAVVTFETNHLPDRIVDRWEEFNYVCGSLQTSRMKAGRSAHK
jgi:hypothetical protein